MSTTIVTQATGEPGIDLSHQRFLIITVLENNAEPKMYQALVHVSQSRLVQDDDEEIDLTEARAEIASELKAEDLTLAGLQICRFAWLGE